MITLFSTPKPFHGHIGVIQRNAIHSWTLLHPDAEIFLFGDDEGTAEVAKELGVGHVPDVARNEYGTPLVSDIFEKAQSLASNDIVCYVNADIILLKDFIRAVERVAGKRRFLMVGQRWNLDLNDPLDFDVDWEETIKALVSQKGKLFTKSGIDYFVFPRGLFMDIPRFAIGRPAWDNWMIYHARSSRYHVIDATQVVMPIHQNHNYSHVPQRKGNTYEGPEAERNRDLAGGSQHIFNLYDVNYLLTKRFLRPAFENQTLLFLMALKRKLMRTPKRLSL
ncbi:MAG: hypothetical protein WA137_04440 [Methanothrix sp.]